MIKKSILIWLSIIPLAVLNGGLRDAVFSPWLGENIARPLSGIILCLLIFIVSLIFIPRIGKGSPEKSRAKTYWKIGALWIVLTVIFETSLVLAMGGNFRQVLEMYDISTGELWLLVVVFMGIVPWLTAKIKRII